ncbi:hypothetical protein [Streptomyces sp. CB01249]|uniref:hypothetical protein n=1 Tax=Streptomyces sp. CB01249 TaxID=1703929 RepID=UPI00116107AC|nr:hypothetical protein [Streptomyces sp. CB01249]
MRSKVLAATAGSAIVVGALVTLLVVQAHGDDHQSARSSVVISHGDQLLPSDTLTDWVTYGDHLVVATVTGQRELAPTPEETEAGEGYIPRVISLRIDNVLWSRNEAPNAPSTFETDIDGWQFHGDRRDAVRMEGEPMLEVGKQYVLPILYFSKTKTVQNAGWSTLSPNSIVPYQEGILGKGDVIPSVRQADGDTKPADARGPFFGKAPEELVSALKSTPPDPAAADAMKLPPDERAKRAHE